MPTKQRRKTPFYRRRKPQPEYDIRLLRPVSLPLSERFETLEDARKYSQQSEQKLGGIDDNEQTFATLMKNCREDGIKCNKPYRAICARMFRIWFIGQLLRIVQESEIRKATILTVLLKAVPYYGLDLLYLKAHNASLRKRLQRNGLGNAVIIGGSDWVALSDTVPPFEAGFVFLGAVAP